MAFQALERARDVGLRLIYCSIDAFLSRLGDALFFTFPQFLMKRLTRSVTTAFVIGQAIIIIIAIIANLKINRFIVVAVEAEYCIWVQIN